VIKKSEISRKVASQFVCKFVQNGMKKKTLDFHETSGINTGLLYVSSEQSTQVSFLHVFCIAERQSNLCEANKL